MGGTITRTPFTQDARAQLRLGNCVQASANLRTSAGVTTEAAKSIASKVGAVRRWFLFLMEVVVMDQPS